MNEWQPIETAPKDGTDILGWDGGDITVCRFSRGSWELSVTGWYAEDSDFDPTHWMNLPEPPK